MNADLQQNASHARPMVAILNTTPETIALLQDVLDDEGFATVAAYILDFKQGERDLEAFFRESQPQAVLYDIAIPYIANWQFFQEQVLARHFLPARCFIVTTTNRSALDRLIAPNDAFELIGRPFDLDAIVEALRRALASETT